MHKNTFVFNNQTLNVTLRDDADTSVYTEIFKLREYRRAEEKIIAANSAIVDVGAHAGFFSLYARTLNPTVPIFALEPEPHNIQALTKTITDNALSDTTIIPKALYDQTGRANLIVTADNHNHYLERPFKNDGQKIRVATITLADLRQAHNIEKIALLKMDIEGGEYAIFASMSDEDFASIEAVVLEYHNTKSTTYKIIETVLREHGFSVEIFPSKFEKTMGFLFAQNKRRT